MAEKARGGLKRAIKRASERVSNPEQEGKRGMAAAGNERRRRREEDDEGEE